MQLQALSDGKCILPQACRGPTLSSLKFGKNSSTCVNSFQPLDHAKSHEHTLRLTASTVYFELDWHLTRQGESPRIHDPAAFVFLNGRTYAGKQDDEAPQKSRTRLFGLWEVEGKIDRGHPPFTSEPSLWTNNVAWTRKASALMQLPVKLCSASWWTGWRG